MKYDTDWPHVGTSILQLVHKNTRASALVVQMILEYFVILHKDVIIYYS